MRYHQNTENPNKNLYFFQDRLTVFDRLRAINYTDWARAVIFFLEKFRLEDMNFSRKNITKFFGTTSHSFQA